RREWLFEHFREVAQRFAFEGVDAPVVEHAALFTRKAGEEIGKAFKEIVLTDYTEAILDGLVKSQISYTANFGK
ncbi:MAG: hypothetical protein GY820_19760, partial [Gammaproteobacteria bacterium]|nr:hypothetical protein [Gammaproteobacteria bacterium]